MKNKADNPAELLRLARKEIKEWTKVREEAEKEIALWQDFIIKLEKTLTY